MRVRTQYDVRVYLSGFGKPSDVRTMRVYGTSIENACRNAERLFGDAARAAPAHDDGPPRDRRCQWKHPITCGAYATTLIGGLIFCNDHARAAMAK